MGTAATTVDGWAMVLTAVNALWCVVNLSIDARNRTDRRRIEDLVERRLRHQHSNIILRRSPNNVHQGPR